MLAPYVLTAEIRRPARLIYLSSGMLHDGNRSLDDLDWTSRRWSGLQAYCDSNSSSPRSPTRWPGGGRT
ncbi:hypothetical protein [Streptomyces sp. SID14478]|uniref:hypothetical protein n=1 Tax=Streptomyces sp. SID14478 TaxID=2706073 RepID=UPI001EF1E560|nr:hypothetical protein [Streptomyces sp. SID14478]